MKHEVVALIVAAGSGKRAGGAVPKQFAKLGGIAIVARAFDSFGDIPVVVVVADGQQAALSEALGGRRVEAIAVGGASRRESVRNGLEAIAAAHGARHVLIHDAARPLVPRAVIDRLLAALHDHAGAVPALAVADTLLRHDGVRQANVSRENLYRVQTPQAFVFDAVLDSHRTWRGGEATDDAQMVEDRSHTVAIVEGDSVLDKITHPADFARAEAMLASRLISRSANGFDVHRLVEGEELWLGGVKIEHTHGLSGHSDADVALHAITDALLGTIGAGDIGMHFPPSDPQWRGARSDRFLAYAADLITRRGGIVDFVDLTLICEAPKIGPYREAMRARIAEILQVPPTRISIKATTTERLGFTGRGEGIAAQAIATVRVPEDM